MFIDTITAPTITTQTTGLDVAGGSLERGESATVSTQTIAIQAAAANNYAGANFKVILDTASVGAASRTNKVLTAGTYVVTVVATPINGVTDAAGTAGTKIYTDINIVVTGPSKVASAVYSTLGEPTATSAVATVSTDNTEAGTITLTQLNASNVAAANESVTVTVTGPGTVGAGSVRGKSVVLAYTAGSALDIKYWADGTAGVASIAVSTASLTFPAKTVTYYAAAAKTFTTTVAPVLKLGTNDSAVSVTAVDANGTNWAGTAYIVASSAADALIGGSATTPVACTYVSSKKIHWCPITAIGVGTAKFKIIDASTVALATATSAEFSAVVSNASVASVKLEFDKATYQPYEKAIIKITPVGST